MSQLENLLKLEENQNLMDKLNKQLINLKKSTKLKADEAKYQEQLARLNQMEQAINTGKSKLKKSDYTLKDYESKVKDLDKDIYSGSITNEKQLSYLTEERKRISDFLGDLETEILENMDIISDVEKEISTIKEKISEFKDGIDLEKHQINESIKKLERAKIQLKDNITSLSKAIDDKLLEKYKRIRESKGSSISIIQGGICGGCHITVPNYLVEDIKKGKIANCESCNRILYLQKTTIEK